MINNGYCKSGMWDIYFLPGPCCNCERSLLPHSHAALWRHDIPSCTARTLSSLCCAALLCPLWQRQEMTAEGGRGSPQTGTATGAMMGVLAV